MKKFLTLILILSFIPCYVSVKAEERDLSNTVEFLSIIGWGEDYTAQTIQPEQEITRAVFAENVAFLIKESETTCDKVFYHDVSRDHWAFNCIGRLTELGILNGVGNNNFNPDDVISTEAAIKILLSAMGCDGYANILGGYPTGYYKIADELDLLKGCSQSNRLTMQDMLIMFENALKSKIYVNKFVDGKIHYELSEKETFMSKHYNLYYNKGILTGCDGVDIINGTRIAQGKVIIDGVVYDTKLENILTNIGSHVEFIYYKENENDDEKEIMWICPTGKTDTFSLNVNDARQFDEVNYILSYYTDDKTREKTTRISRGVIVVYNGAFVSGNVGEILKKEKSNIKLVNSGKGEYDIAIVECYENYIVGIIDSKNLIVYDKNDGTKSISFNESDWENISITSENMEKSFSDIREGDVLSVFKSYDSGSVKIVISNATLEGNVSAYGSDSEISFTQQKYISIDDVKYYGYEANVFDDINMNDTVKLYLDYNGFVVYANKTSIKNKAAYIIRAYYDDSEEKGSLRILTDDGKTDVYSYAEKLRVDGAVYKQHKAVNDLFINGDKTQQQLVLVSFNQNNEIREIDTLTPNTGSDFEKYLSATSGIYRVNVDKLGAKVLLDSSTKIFAVPSGYSLDYDKFSVKGKADLKNDTTYTADVYRYVKNDLEFEQVLVIRDVIWNAPSGSTPVVLVEEVDLCLDDNGEVVEYVKGYQGHAPVEIKTNGEYSFLNDGVGKGDMIRVTPDKNGRIERASIVYDYGSTNRPLSTDLNSASRVACVYAHNKIGDALQVGYASGADFDEVFNMTNAKILIYDEKKEEISIGTMGDIRTYKSMGNKCSTIVAQTCWSEPIVFVVYLSE